MQQSVYFAQGPWNQRNSSSSSSSSFGSSRFAANRRRLPGHCLLETNSTSSTSRNSSSTTRNSSSSSTTASNSISSSSASASTMSGASSGSAGSCTPSNSSAHLTTCAVCLEKPKLHVGRPNACDAHMFCFRCIMEWAQISNSCPLCKAEFTSVTRHAVGGGPALETVVVGRVKQKDVYADDVELWGVTPELPPSNCRVCGSADDEPVLLLCDGCDDAYHMYCLSPQLAAVPEGDWFCRTCERARRREASRATQRRPAAARSSSSLPNLLGWASAPGSLGPDEEEEEKDDEAYRPRDSLGGYADDGGFVVGDDDVDFTQSYNPALDSPEPERRPRSQLRRRRRVQRRDEAGQRGQRAARTTPPPSGSRRGHTGKQSKDMGKGEGSNRGNKAKSIGRASDSSSDSSSSSSSSDGSSSSSSSDSNSNSDGDSGSGSESDTTAKRKRADKDFLGNSVTQLRARRRAASRRRVGATHKKNEEFATPIDLTGDFDDGDDEEGEPAHEKKKTRLSLDALDQFAFAQSPLHPASPAAPKTPTPARPAPRRMTAAAAAAAAFAPTPSPAAAGARSSLASPCRTAASRRRDVAIRAGLARLCTPLSRAATTPVAPYSAGELEALNADVFSPSPRRNRSIPVRSLADVFSDTPVVPPEPATHEPKDLPGLGGIDGDAIMASDRPLKRHKPAEDITGDEGVAELSPLAEDRRSLPRQLSSSSMESVSLRRQLSNSSVESVLVVSSSLDQDQEDAENELPLPTSSSSSRSTSATVVRFDPLCSVPDSPRQRTPATPARASHTCVADTPPTVPLRRRDENAAYRPIAVVRKMPRLSLPQSSASAAAGLQENGAGGQASALASTPPTVKRPNVRSRFFAN